MSRQNFGVVRTILASASPRLAPSDSPCPRGAAATPKEKRCPRRPSWLELKTRALEADFAAMERYAASHGGLRGHLFSFCRVGLGHGRLLLAASLFQKRARALAQQRRLLLERVGLRSPQR